MSAIKKIRLTCDIKNPSRLIDEYTGARPVIYRDEAIEIHFAAIQNGIAHGFTQTSGGMPINALFELLLDLRQSGF